MHGLRSAFAFSSPLSTCDNLSHYSRSSSLKSSPSRDFSNHLRMVRSDVVSQPHVLMAFRIPSAALWSRLHSWSKTTQISRFSKRKLSQATRSHWRNCNGETGIISCNNEKNIIWLHSFKILFNYYCKNMAGAKMAIIRHQPKRCAIMRLLYSRSGAARQLVDRHNWPPRSVFDAPLRDCR